MLRPDEQKVSLEPCDQHVHALGDLQSPSRWIKATVPDVVRFPQTHLDVSTSLTPTGCGILVGIDQRLAFLIFLHQIKFLFPLLVEPELPLYYILLYSLSIEFFILGGSYLSILWGNRCVGLT